MIIDLQRFLASERSYWAELERKLARLEAEPNYRMKLEELRQFRHPRALGIARPPRGAARDEAFDLAARLE